MKRGFKNEIQAFAFRLDAHSGVPVYRQLIDQVQAAVDSSILTTGDQLPTVRQGSGRSGDQSQHSFPCLPGDGDSRIVGHAARDGHVHRRSEGRHQLAQMITERETLGQELQKILDEKTTPWA
jgi:hypothetical protein